MKIIIGKEKTPTNDSSKKACIKLCEYSAAGYIYICTFPFRLLIWEVNLFPLESTSTLAG